VAPSPKSQNVVFDDSQIASIAIACGEGFQISGCWWVTGKPTADLKESALTLGADRGLPVKSFVANRRAEKSFHFGKNALYIQSSTVKLAA
jgi:hypothetical protein